MDFQSIAPDVKVGKNGKIHKLVGLGTVLDKYSLNNKLHGIYRKRGRAME